jgi:ATP-binding cassette subfamily B protein
MVEQYQDGLSGYLRFSEIMNTMPDIQDVDNALDLQITSGRIEFDNVTFKYNEGQDYVLQDILLNIQAGETVAVVGVSGTGKTTLCSLIPRFYDISKGEVRIDGVNIRNVTQSSLRRQIGVVSQDNFLFSGTVFENILYGKPDATEEQVKEAAKMADAHDFIIRLSDGYNTEIGERGVKLSGGQKQRISIARVFLKNPPILIFDEATSALDYESEKAVMKSMQTLTKGRTKFIIAYRLSTVQNVNRIIVLTDDGITEQGTHEQMLESGSAY